ncbi:uncharacterized protein LOC110685712 [Chenopodium quinoa]|uniref:uncharacterized protein LOC110685712 n=1 Tax=Chenopodium quinoa TaxID=63459 RepID=UPI000B79917F|nr:uncharacterized protein LOC110685712 [Chenopodium quinoa]
MGVNIVNCMWLFKHKLKSNGDLERRKARLVCDGRSQEVGVDCDETFSPETIYMHQPTGFVDWRAPSYEKYVWEILERAGMGSCKLAAIPVDTKSKLSADAGPPFRDPTLYRSLAGTLHYLTFTRPYIAYAVQQGHLVSWSSKRQHTLSKSSAEAEYRGVANVVSEACWLRNFLLELHCPLRQATIVYCDNVSAIYLFGNPVQHQRTKHVEMDIHFVREMVALGQVRVLYVPSRYQFADIFTKGLPRGYFWILDPILAYDLLPL